MARGPCFYNLKWLYERFLHFTINFLLIFGFLQCGGFVKFTESAIQPSYTHSTLLFNTYSEIFLTNVTRSGNLHFESVFKGLGKGAALDYFYEKQLVCWSDEDSEHIDCTKLNDSTVKSKSPVIKSGLDKPEGLAIDWWTEKIYWTDAEMTRIEVATIGGKYQKVLFWSDLDQPRAIALVPSRKLMIWTDWGENPKIERASMDGDPFSRKVLVSDDIFWPNGLVVDLEKDLIYWVDGNLAFIDVMDLDGNNRKRIVKNLAYPHSLTYSNNRLFWTDWKLNEIHSFDVNTSTEMLPIKTPDVPIVVRAWDAKLQPTGDNPCKINNGNCSHLCLLATNSKGYSCACPTGIKLITSTQCADGPQEMLFLVQRTQISRISLDSMDFTSFPMQLGKIKYAIAIDYDPIEDFIYWTDADLHTIRRAHMNGSSIMDIVNTEIEHPDGLAIDPLARNLYWTDPIKDRIELCRLDGSSRKVVIHEDLEEPRAIALAPEYGWMFWSDWNEKKPKIERASLDGTDRVVLITDNLGWPNGIALDLDAKKMYWCDAKTDKIEMINMDGTDRRVILNENLAHSFGLSLLGDYIYWTDWQHRSVDRVNKKTGGDRTTVVDQFPDVMGLKVARLKEVKGTSPCSYKNGGCSHSCLNRPQDYVCRCPIDQELDRDKKTCIIPEAFLLFSRKTMIGTKVIGRISIEFNEDNHNNNIIPFKDVKDSHGMDVNIAEKRIYWTNQKCKCIMRAFINGSDIQKIVESGLILPEGIAVDWLANNLYWTDTSANRIEVARTDGSSRRILLWKGIVEPKQIALEPTKGYMYWTELASDSLKRAFMDGTDVKTIVKSANHATGLTIDPYTRQLYWACETRPGTIETADWEGNKTSTLLNLGEDNLQNAVTLYQDYLYYSVYGTGDIGRVNKFTGKNHTLIHRGLDYMDSLLTFHSSRQPRTNHSCVNNGGCSHLCLTLPMGRSTCSCPTHYKLSSDNMKCIPPKNFFIFSQKTTFGRLIPNTSDSPDAPLPISDGGKNIRSIEFDSLTQYLYWIDGRTQTIKMNNGTNTVVLINTGPSPYDLALDPIGKLLFWTCSHSNKINVTNLIFEDSLLSVDTIDIGNTEKPRSIALHPVKRLIFWTDVGMQPAIYRARMDGAERRALATKLDGITALAIDTTRDLIYFALESKVIDVMDINGKNRKNLVSTHMNLVISIAALDDFVYWIDEKWRTERVTVNGENRRPDLQRYQITDIISVVTPDKNILNSHLCMSPRNKCSHICVASPDVKSSEICSCPHGLRIMDDKKICGALPACGPDHFTCATPLSNGLNGHKECIPAAWRCDGQDDCPDKSDEIGCSACNDGQFKCQSGECIDRKFVCDGTTHCADGNDEADCCRPPNDFQCPGNKVCIPRAYLCDGWENCADGSDESAETCPIKNEPIPSTSDKQILITLIILGMLIMFFALYVSQLCRSKFSNNNNVPKDDLAAAPLSPNGLNKTTTRITKLASVADAMKMSNINTRNSINSYDRNHITGASSSTTNGSSMIGYPLNPPPSPATTATSTRYSSYRPYRHYKMINQPPPPTPCSTDVCDESDSIYTSKSHRSVCGGGGGSSGSKSGGSGGSKKMYRYDEPYPPPPTPRSHYHSDMPESCPPSPSSRSSTYFAPLPPPPSPDHYSPSKGYS